jgi:leader peptidase (prepilin peptidase)/N-methyltransferase
MVELTIISSLLGLSLGSFVNVCTYRLPRGISVVHLRSFCPFCRRQLDWIELIPIVGFAISRGRCKSCSENISFLYPIIELFVAGVAVWVFQQNGLSLKALESLVFFLLMLTIALIDWKHFIIPNQLVIVGFISGMIIKGLISQDALIDGFIASFFSTLTLLIIMLLGNYLLKKQSMGFGDIKLAAVMGLFLGYQNFIISLWIAAIFGAIYGLTNNKLLNRTSKIEHQQLLITHNSNLVTHNLPIPFGSFLAFASVIVFFFQQQIHGLIDAWLIWNL